MSGGDSISPSSSLASLPCRLLCAPCCEPARRRAARSRWQRGCPVVRSCLRVGGENREPARWRGRALPGREATRLRWRGGREPAPRRHLSGRGKAPCPSTCLAAVGGRRIFLLCLWHAGLKCHRDEKKFGVVPNTFSGSKIHVETAPPWSYVDLWSCTKHFFGSKIHGEAAPPWSYMDLQL
jgi:hypothetical protein